jgi:hypothetical protein
MKLKEPTKVIKVEEWLGIYNNILLTQLLFLLFQGGNVEGA